ncbi:hypothetical protein AB8Z38_16000 [Bradyrhizobium sp. LLZ17]|uniref:Uncharacterized protein n=1 Tax=Bradyrhizobium sp. LLZ17 TaxID=3239388 RepID=A0AB39XWU9_9BRAD
MTPVAILLFLVGAVLAWRFRVWILVPFSLIAIVVTFVTQLSLGAGLAVACGYGMLMGFAPQTGYAFGLLAQTTLLARYSRKQPFSRKASVTALYRRMSADNSGR